MYLPSLGYPLAMNHFTRQELHIVQKNAIRAIAARCGYNRNTHRAILFGSTKYGGANFRHLYSIQGEGQLQLFLKYWRSPTTQAGQVLRISVAWFQSAAGISRPVFEDVTTPLAYSDSKWLLSIRTYLNHIGGSITLRPTFISDRRRLHDRYIMDDIIESKLFTPREICLLNLCRLYLQVLLLSDLTNAEGTYLDKFIIIGQLDHRTSSQSVTHRFVQDRPSQRAWALWKKANKIWSNGTRKLNEALGPWVQLPAGQKPRRSWPAYSTPEGLYIRSRVDFAHYQVHRIISHPSRYMPTPNTILYEALPVDACPVDVTRSFPSGYRLRHAPHLIIDNPVHPPTEYTSFGAFIAQHDPWEFELLERTELMCPRAYDIIDATTEGITFACDGSVNAYGAGSFGWKASDAQGNRLVQCSGPARGHRISSYRSEGYGMLSVFRFLDRIHVYCEQSINAKAVTVVCDNKSMVQQVAELIPTSATTYTTDSETHRSLTPLQPEWDLLQEIWHTIRTWDSFAVVHVKGHQDRHRRYQDLDLHAQLNVDADFLAAQYLREHPQPKPNVLLFPHTHAQFHIQDTTITSRYSLRIRNADSDPTTIEYLKQRYKWTDEIFLRVNWTVHGKAIRSQQHRRLHISKLVNDILPTNKVQHRWNPRHSQKCTMCQHEIETRDHLLRCTSSVTWRGKFMADLRHKCERLTTAPSLRHLLLHGIHAWMSGNDHISSEGFTGDYITLIQEQNSIGWRQLFNGRWSVSWSRIQGRFLGETGVIGSSTLGDKWNVAIIQEVWEGWSQLWKARNTKVHGDDAITRRAADLRAVKTRIRAVYALRGRVDRQLAPVLETSMEEQMAKGLVFLRNWLSVYEERLYASANRQRDRDLQGMRPLEFYFGHIDDPG